MASTAAARYVSSSQPRSQPLPPAKPATAAPAPAPGLEAAEGSTPRAGAADLALLARLRLGDEAAFAELIDQHHGALLRLALVFVANRAMAEEVVQETWSAVLVGLDAFEGRSSLKTWIFRILTNRAKTRAVREGRTVSFSAFGNADLESSPAVAAERFRPDGRWSSPPEPWDEETPERLMLRREIVDLISAALDDLPAAQRAVVLLRDVDGLESAEVCNILRISETNQRVLHHRARSKLRRTLEEYVGAPRRC